jgi:hypothetical protein
MYPEKEGGPSPFGGFISWHRTEEAMARIAKSERANLMLYLG